MKTFCPLLLAVLLSALLITSCRFFNAENNQSALKEEIPTTLVGWDYLSKIVVHVPGGRSLSGYECDANLYVKGVANTVFYKIVVMRDDHKTRDVNQEYLVERNPKYGSNYIGDEYVRAYKYKADWYYFNMDSF